MGSCFGRSTKKRENAYGNLRIDFGQTTTVLTQEDPGIVQSMPGIIKYNKSNMEIPNETDACPIPERVNVYGSRGSEGMSQEGGREEEDDDVYPMKNNPHGICIIIANEHFGELFLGQRKGNENDVKRLEALFQRLGFIVEIKKDSTAEDMKNHLRAVRSRITSNMDCFVVVICSHGREDGVIGTDGLTVSKEKIRELFDGDNCKVLEGKPKLFLFQACAGAKRDNPARTVIDGPNSTIPTPPPTKADMFTASASYPGYVSIRNEEDGSWFIQTLVDEVEKNVNKDINTIMTKVTRIVGKKQADLGKGDRSSQCVHTESTLQKLFYF